MFFSFFPVQDEVTGSCTEEYSPEYLQRYRQQLMDKVRAYQEELERERLEKKLILETEEQRLPPLQNNKRHSATLDVLHRYKAS